MLELIIQKTNKNKHIIFEVENKINYLFANSTQLTNSIATENANKETMNIKNKLLFQKCMLSLSLTQHSFPVHSRQTL